MIITPDNASFDGRYSTEKGWNRHLIISRVRGGVRADAVGNKRVRRQAVRVRGLCDVIRQK